MRDVRQVGLTFEIRHSTFRATAGNRQRLQTILISSVTATEDLHKQSKQEAQLVLG